MTVEAQETGRGGVRTLDPNTPTLWLMVAAGPLGYLQGCEPPSAPFSSGWGLHRLEPALWRGCFRTASALGAGWRAPTLLLGLAVHSGC